MGKMEFSVRGTPESSTISDTSSERLSSRCRFGETWTQGGIPRSFYVTNRHGAALANHIAAYTANYIALHYVPVCGAEWSRHACLWRLPQNKLHKPSPSQTQNQIQTKPNQKSKPNQNRLTRNGWCVHMSGHTHSLTKTNQMQKQTKTTTPKLERKQRGAELWENTQNPVPLCAVAPPASGWPPSRVG